MKRISLLKEVRTVWVASVPDNTDIRERNGKDLKKMGKVSEKAKREEKGERQ